MDFHGFHVSGRLSWCLMVPGWFSWFFMVPGWFFMFFHGSRLVFYGSRLVFNVFFSRMYLPELYPGPTVQSRSAAQRAAQDLVD